MALLRGGNLGLQAGKEPRPPGVVGEKPTLVWSCELREALASEDRVEADPLAQSSPDVRHAPPRMPHHTSALEPVAARAPIRTAETTLIGLQPM